MTAEALMAAWRRLTSEDRSLILGLTERLAGPEPEEPDVGVITGTVAYRERVAMPPDALVRVSLHDVARADAPSLPLAEEVIEQPGNVPVRFELNIDTGSLSPQGSYAVRAVIEVGGKVRWTTDTTNRVDPADLPVHVHLLLRGV